jgi:hypothetical protein
MSTGSVIKGFNILERALACLSSWLKALLINAFGFEAMKEGFGYGIVVTIGCATQTDRDGLLLQKRQIAFARIGTATIRMKQ